MGAVSGSALRACCVNRPPIANLIRIEETGIRSDLKSRTTNTNDVAGNRRVAKTVADAVSRAAFETGEARRDQVPGLASDS